MAWCFTLMWHHCNFSLFFTEQCRQHHGASGHFAAADGGHQWDRAGQGHLSFLPANGWLASGKNINSILNTLRPRRNGRHFPDDFFKCIFCNENVWIAIKIPLKFVHKGPVNNILALVRIGLAPNRRHAIIWTKDGSGYRRMYTTLGLDELNRYYNKRTPISTPLSNTYQYLALLLLVTSRNESLPGPMLTKIFVDIWRRYATMRLLINAQRLY